VEVEGLPTLQDAPNHCEGRCREHTVSIYVPFVSRFLSRSEYYNHNLSFYSSRPSINIVRARHDESTSNLSRHVQKCTPVDSKEAHAMQAYSQGSQYTPAQHRMKLALWVARRNRPFAIVEDPELLDIFSDLNSRCVTPGRRTVSRDIKEIFTLSRAKVAAILQVRLAFRYIVVSIDGFRRNTLARSTSLAMGGHLPTSLRSLALR
jgi:hypothetical protein